MTAAISVLLVDDHAMFRDGLRTLIDSQSDMHVVGEASDGDEGALLAKQLEPTVVVMDLSMPKCGGIEAIARMRRWKLRSRALVLSMFDDQTYLRAALAAGASGYVPKRAAGKQLLDAVRQISQNHAYIAISLNDGSLEQLVSSPETMPTSPFSCLTDREHEVLELLAQGHTHTEIGQRLQLSSKTIDTYRQRVNQKLGLRTRADLVRFAIETGLLTPSRPPDVRNH